MADLLVTNATAILPDRLAEGWSVLCERGRIVRAGPDPELKLAPAAEQFDAGGLYLAPGFIDLHLHGMRGFLLNDGPDSLAAVARIVPRYGVTGFLPTVFPPVDGAYADLVASLAAAKTEGAEVLGILLEGPFLSECGAIPRKSLGSTQTDVVAGLLAAARPRRAVFVVSPEYDGINRLLPMMTAGGIPAFLAHTRAGVAETQRAIAAGARHATHFYDVFYPPPETEIGKRPCGAVEAVLADPSATVDFILDGEHVDPVAVKMALACKGYDGVSLITDANRGAGLPPGRYSFGPYEVESLFEGGPARFTRDHPEYPGALAGSGLTMDRAVRNALRLLALDLPAAVRMASSSPARVLGLADRKGRIAAGFHADLALLDRDLEPVRTWVGGVLRFDREAQGSDPA